MTLSLPEHIRGFNFDNQRMAESTAEPTHVRRAEWLMTSLCYVCDSTVSGRKTCTLLHGNNNNNVTLPTHLFMLYGVKMVDCNVGWSVHYFGPDGNTSQLLHGLLRHLYRYSWAPPQQSIFDLVPTTGQSFFTYTAETIYSISYHQPFDLNLTNTLIYDKLTIWGCSDSCRSAR